MEDIISNGQASEWIDQGIALVMAYAPKVVLAIITLIVGLWLINRFVGVLDNKLGKKDPTLNKFLCGLAHDRNSTRLIFSQVRMSDAATSFKVNIIGAAGLAV